MDSQFALKYDKHSRLLEEMMNENLNKSHFADVILIGEDKIPFHGHRFVLGIQSSVLRDLFLSNQEDSSIIFFDGWTSSEIQCLLDYVYLGKASLNLDEVDNFIHNAKSLKIKKFDHNLKESLFIMSSKSISENPKSGDSAFRVLKEESLESDEY